jgi:hypothetical protein
MPTKQSTLSGQGLRTDLASIKLYSPARCLLLGFLLRRFRGGLLLDFRIGGLEVQGPFRVGAEMVVPHQVAAGFGERAERALLVILEGLVVFPPPAGRHLHGHTSSVWCCDWSGWCCRARVTLTSSIWS